MIGFGVLVVLALLVGIVFGYLGFFASQRLSRDLDLHRRTANKELAALRRSIEQLQTPGPSPSVRDDEIADPSEEPRSEPAPAAPDPKPVLRPAAPPPKVLKTQAKDKVKTTGGGFEEALASRWLVWLGAIALALGGAFLVKYSIDQGLLGPAVRLTIAAIVGIGLIAAGEWLRQSPLHTKVIQERADYVPPALSSAGVFTIFGAIYAAYGLYGFIGSSVAFVGLAGAAFAALALSLLQGPLIAAIGLVGALLTPLLVTTAEPSAWGLLTYLLFVLAASFAVLRYRNWWWLAIASVLGSLVWGFVFFAFGVAPNDALPGFLYVAGLMALPVLLARPDAQAFMSARRGLDLIKGPEGKVFLSVIFAVSGANGLALLLFDGINFGTTSLIFLALLAALQLGLGRKYEGLSGVALLGGGLVVVALLLWPMDFVTTDLERLTDDQSLNLSLTAFAFYVSLALFAVGFGVFGYLAVSGSKRPGRWAALSALMPLALVAAGYLKHVDGRDLWGWPVAVALVSIFLLGAAERMHKRGSSASLAAYACGVLSATTLALVFMLEEAWLTVALSLQLPVMAWVYNRLPIPAMRPLGLLLAGLVLVRLFLNWNIFGYPLSPVPIVNWILYGYGVPALAFYWASRQFRRDKDDLLVQVLEGGACAFAVSLVTLQIHHWVNDGNLTANYFTFLEVSLQSAAWSVLCIGAYWRELRHNRKILVLARKLLFGLTAIQVIGLHLILLNPLFAREWVGAWPIVNGVLLGFGVPALAAAVYGWIAYQRGGLARARQCLGASLILTFVMVSLQVKQYFSGAYLHVGSVSDAEMYTLSVVWILFAIGLMALSLRTHVKALRQASFVVILLAVAKVFIFDMSQLEGLLRVLSFFGLGLSLVGIGYVYQRYVFAAKTTPPEAPNSA